MVSTWLWSAVTRISVSFELVSCGGHAHGFGERDGVGERAIGIAGVVPMVDAAALHHQVVALLVLLQHLDGLGGHLGQRGFACQVPGAIGLVLHVAGLEQAEQVVDVLRIHVAGSPRASTRTATSAARPPIRARGCGRRGAGPACRGYSGSAVPRSEQRRCGRRPAPPRCHCRSSAAAPAARRCRAAWRWRATGRRIPSRGSACARSSTPAWHA